MLLERSDGLYAGWRTVWADWAVHFSYANVFAYWPVGDWFSSNPVFATAGFAYPFLADALSGLLMRAGMELVWAFLLPSIAASLALVSLLFLFYALLLGSWGALEPAILLAMLMVIRTALEDHTLQAELPGYAEYARQVRFRLLPGVW